MDLGPRHVLTILAVSDLPRSLAFYRAVLERDAVVSTPVYAELVLAGGMRLGLYERHGFGRNTGQVPAEITPGALAPTELYLYADDLASTLARVSQSGARLLSPLARRDWGDEAAYFADPDGNVIVIARPLK